MTEATELTNLITNDGPNGTRSLYQGIAVTQLRSQDGACVVIADHGAHVLSWIPAQGKESLYLSTASRYGGQTAIRGGVPVIFPKFAELGTGRRHGFARVLPWVLQDAAISSEGAAVATWQLQGRFDGPSDSASKDQSSEYKLSLQVRVVAKELAIMLTVENTASTSWEFNAALHTYLQVSDRSSCQITGLQNCPYIDQTQQPADKTCRDQTPLLFSGEIDRIYPNAPAAVRLFDQELNRSREILISQSGFVDTVIWNPGAKAKQLADLETNGERRFVCVEAATVKQTITLSPGASWHGTQIITVT